MKRVLHVVGARPNFMKVAPIMRQMAKLPQEFDQILVHTGQHYDANMSQVFFDELELPRPDINLGVGSGSHTHQTANVMLRFEPALLTHNPDWVIVVGDVNSTLACTLVCSKLGIKVAHVEAGLRSFDRSMPEEINRVLVDQIADLLFTPSRDVDENLLREGIAWERIRFVGNVMIDTLVHLLPKAEARWRGLSSKLDLERFVLVTLHRPINVDNINTLIGILLALDEISRAIPVIFPVHPRTRMQINSKIWQPVSTDLKLIEPLGYLDFLALEVHAALVLTDSGGVQEETTYLNIPCLTMRPNTERPVTLTQGTNRLVNSEHLALVHAVRTALDHRGRSGDRGANLAPTGQRAPELWDGRAAERIVEVLAE